MQCREGDRIQMGKAQDRPVYKVDFEGVLGHRLGGGGKNLHHAGNLVLGDGLGFLGSPTGIAPVIVESAFAHLVFSAVLGQGQATPGEGGDELTVELRGPGEPKAGALLMGYRFFHDDFLLNGNLS